MKRFHLDRRDRRTLIIGASFGLLLPFLLILMSRIWPETYSEQGYWTTDWLARSYIPLSPGLYAGSFASRLGSGFMDGRVRILIILSFFAALAVAYAFLFLLMSRIVHFATNRRRPKTVDKIPET